MLKPAIQYQEELTKILGSLWFEEKYKFYLSGWSCDIPEIKIAFNTPLITKPAKLPHIGKALFPILRNAPAKTNEKADTK